MPDSATATTSARDAGRQGTGALVVDREGAQVPLVDPDQPGPGAQGAVELLLVVHLDQGGQAERAGAGREAGQLVVVEGGGDQQHGVGPHEAGVDHVELLSR